MVHVYSRSFEYQDCYQWQFKAERRDKEVAESRERGIEPRVTTHSGVVNVVGCRLGQHITVIADLDNIYTLVAGRRGDGVTLIVQSMFSCKMGQFRYWRPAINALYAAMPHMPERRSLRKVISEVLPEVYEEAEKARKARNKIELSRLNALGREIKKKEKAERETKRAARKAEKTAAKLAVQES